MHVELSNKKLQNTTYVADIQQGFHNRNTVVVYLTNGTRYIEGIYSNETEAKSRVEELRGLLVY